MTAATAGRGAGWGGVGMRVSEELQATFGGQIKHQRQMRGIGLRALARTVSIVPSHLQGIENNVNVPSVFVAWRIATALGTTVDELLSHQPIGVKPAHQAPGAAAAGGEDAGR